MTTLVEYIFIPWRGISKWFSYASSVVLKLGGAGGS